MENLSKKDILQKVIISLSESVKKAGQSLSLMNNDINDAPGAMQSHSDTTRFQLTSIVDGLEKSYQEKSKELELLNQFLQTDFNNSKFDISVIGSVVTIKKSNNLLENYFIVPGGSGIKVDYNGKKIVCITPASPLGKAIIGKKKGQSFAYSIGGMSQNIEMIEIF
jgi:hypothetical protein